MTAAKAVTRERSFGVGMHNCVAALCSSDSLPDKQLDLSYTNL